MFLLQRQKEIAMRSHKTILEEIAPIAQLIAEGIYTKIPETTNNIAELGEKM